jgi:Tfp pilus assembly protein PilF
MKLHACLLLISLACTLHAQPMPSHSISLNAASSLRSTRFSQDDPFMLFDGRYPDQTQSTSPGGIISVNQLSIPTKAVKEFQRSQKSFQAGDLRSACAHLEKALQIYPNFVEAHNNLAGAYVDMREYERAAEQLRLAIAINPNVDVPYNNLSSALFSLGRYSEGEEAARQALRLNPLRNTTRYNLGRALAAQEHYTLEAAEALRLASKEIPQARLMLALVLSKRGTFDQAAAELREYLKAPDPALRQAVQEWLTELDQLRVTLSKR